MLDSSFSHSRNQSSAHFLSTVLKLFPESNHFLAVPLRLPNCLHLSLGLNDTCAFTLTPYIPYTVVNSASWGIWWKSELDCICLCSEIFRGFPSPPLEAKSLGRPRGFLWPFQSHLPLLSPSFIQPQLHWLSHTLRHVPTSGPWHWLFTLAEILCPGFHMAPCHTPSKTFLKCHLQGVSNSPSY